MISNIKYSILLPGAFFDNRWPHKIDMIIEKFNCNTIYFFDHTINPINTDYPIYKQFEAIQEVLDYRKDIRLGTLVTNLSRSSGDDICFSLSSIMSATNCFDFGIGVGDSVWSGLSVISAPKVFLSCAKAETDIELKKSVTMFLLNFVDIDNIGKIFIEKNGVIID